MHKEEKRLRAKAAPSKAALQLAMASDYQGALNAGTGRNCSFNEVIGMINAQLGTERKQKHIEDPIKNYVRDTLADTASAGRYWDSRPGSRWKRDKAAGQRKLEGLREEL